MSYHASEKIGTENRRKGMTPVTINIIAATTPVLHCRPPPRKICNGAEKPLQTFPHCRSSPNIISTVLGFIFIYSFYFFVILWENTRHLDNWMW